jgi:hypothetical protein
MIEALASRVIDKLIAMHRKTGTPEDSIMYGMGQNVVADLVKEDLSSAGENCRRNPMDRDHR